MSHRLLLPTIVLSLLVGSASAQRSGLGIKGGVLAATTKAIQIRTTNIPGGTLGLYYSYHAGPRMEFQPELLLTAMGSGFVEPDGDRISLRTLMIQVPVSAKVYFNNVINIQGGVQFGKVVSATRSQGEDRRDVTADMRPVDFGLTAGIGADLISGVDLTLRYFSGLWTIYQYDDALFPRNRTLQFTAGYRFVRTRGHGGNRRRH